MNAVKMRKFDEIEDALDEIDRQIPPENIPTEDRPVLARARALSKRLKEMQCKYQNYFHLLYNNANSSTRQANRVFKLELRI